MDMAKKKSTGNARWQEVDLKCIKSKEEGARGAASVRTLILLYYNYRRKRLFSCGGPGQAVLKKCSIQLGKTGKINRA